jgi:hypothetical protein
LLVADGEVVESDKLVGVVGEVGIEIAVRWHTSWDSVEHKSGILQLTEKQNLLQEIFDFGS